MLYYCIDIAIVVIMLQQLYCYYVIAIMHNASWALTPQTPNQYLWEGGTPPAHLSNAFISPKRRHSAYGDSNPPPP